MTLIVIIFSVSILLQFVAVFLSFRLIRTTGWQLAWSIIALALLFMGVRRSISFIQLLKSGIHPPSYVPELVALGISLLMVVGVYLIGPAFALSQRASFAIKQSEQRFRGLFESSDAPIVIIDFSEIWRRLSELSNQGLEDFDGYLSQHPNLPWKMLTKVAVVQANPASKNLFGADLMDTYKDKGLESLFAPGTMNAFIKILKAIWRGEDRCGSEVDLINSRGDIRHCIFSMPIPKSEADSHEIPITILDISDLKQAETELKRQQEIFYRAQKMESLGNLTGGIAHDFNNLLGIIQGYTELLALKAKDMSDLGDYVNEIQAATRRGAQLTQKLLAFSSQEKSQAQSVNLGKILNDHQDMLQKVLTARIQLEINSSHYLWNTYLDPGDFTDAVLNISLNAKHAMEQGGKLVFTLNNCEIDGEEAAKQKMLSGSYVKLTVADTGEGMDESIQSRIFEPFFTTKKEAGTGLGLSQVYGFVKRSGGTVKLQSKPGHGTQFDFYFPRLDHVTEQEQESNFDDEAFTGSETILVVDDEPAFRQYLQEVLKTHGYHTIVASGGQQAMQVLGSTNVDLLLSDVIMPQMDGYELAATVRQKYPHIIIQLISGFHQEQNLDETLTASVGEILHKPITSQQLLRAIRQRLDASSETCA